MFVQVFGSLCVLVPFVLVQLGRLSSTSRWYGWLNLTGSSLLAVEAAIGHDWGFLLLEGVWAAVSLHSLTKVRADNADVPVE
ncbi:hypothetical protein Daura_33855 [Dactylosporangium aurantiacum]|uniref:CBU-0592-like domain-containing protein n=1 Tax=Dactylosporangium aurantiacum TaxID=35754 RepID=A0A9Q9MJ96_9ACTN|nr:hypothetical protein [Dactylosporangium aurantiacum]MDG6105180.1 hypothetical protein [Dactylosporangium aurantiacum]UWZ51702.1 hypothetical protein Daura_33855 [Dactylosporangium aurantiacum]